MVENCHGQKVALEFANKYEARESLCRLVYDLGPTTYSYITDNVMRWREKDFLF